MSLIRKIVGYSKLIFRLNLIKTIYINFRVFEWQIAIKTPIYIFGPIELANLSGGFIINGNITRGMIHFGSDDENIIATREPARIFVSGKLIFNGGAKFARAVQLLVWDNGTLNIGGNSWFGSFTKIVAFRNILIGKNFMASWECQIFDTDFHFIMDKVDDSIRNNSADVLVGENVWIGSRVSILKGTLLGDETIVAASSICNANYLERYSNSIILGGIPAKLLRKDVAYVFDKKMEKKLFRFFSDDQDMTKVYSHIK